MKTIYSALTVAAFSLFTSAFAQKQAIILGDDVRLRDKPTTSGKIVSQQKLGAVCSLLEESKTYEYVDPKKPTENHCDRHKWLKVKTKDGKTGWVYGQFAAILEAPIEFQGKKSFSLNGTSYALQLAALPGYPSAVPDGEEYSGDISGCSEKWFPVLVGGGKVHFITSKAPDKGSDQWVSFGMSRNFWRVEHNDGIQQSIAIKSVSANEWRIVLTTEGQDSYKGLTELQLTQDAASGFLINIANFSESNR